MPQTKNNSITNEEEEDAQIEDNNKLLTNKFSTSVRTKTIISFIFLVVVFTALVFGTYYALCPQFVSKYERRKSESEADNLLFDINDELSVLYVF